MSLFNKSEIKNISATEGKKLLEENNNIILVDVRSDEEYKSGHIPKSINIPTQEVQKAVEDGRLSKEKEIIMYCHSGARSGRALKMLKILGFEKVYNMGGITEWPYDIEK